MTKITRIAVISILFTSATAAWAEGKISKLRTELVPFNAEVLAEMLECSDDYSKAYLCEEELNHNSSGNYCDTSGKETSPYTLEFDKPIKLTLKMDAQKTGKLSNPTFLLRPGEKKAYLDLYPKAGELSGFSLPAQSGPPFACEISFFVGDLDIPAALKIDLDSKDYKEVTFNTSFEHYKTSDKKYEWSEFAALYFDFPIEEISNIPHAQIFCRRLVKTNTPKPPLFSPRSFFGILGIAPPKIRRIPKNVCKEIKNYSKEKNADLLEFIKQRPKLEKIPDALASYLSLPQARNDQSFELGYTVSKDRYRGGATRTCLKGKDRFISLPTFFYARAQEKFDAKDLSLVPRMQIAASDSIKVLEDVRLEGSVAGMNDKDFEKNCGTHYIAAIEYGDEQHFDGYPASLVRLSPLKKQVVSDLTEKVKQLHEELFKKGGPGTPYLAIASPGKELDQSLEFLFDEHAKLADEYDASLPDYQLQNAKRISKSIDSMSFLRSFESRPDPRDRRPVIYRIESYDRLRQGNNLKTRPVK